MFGIVEQMPKTHTYRAAAFSAVTVLAMAGCAPNTARRTDPGPYGHIVLGPRSGLEFDMTAGDTLPELPVDRVPQAVKHAAEADGEAAGFQPGCTRYFVGGRSFLAVLVSACNSPQPREDGLGLAAYTADGVRRGHLLMTLTDADYLGLEPSYR